MNLRWFIMKDISAIMLLEQKNESHEKQEEVIMPSTKTNVVMMEQ